MSDLAMSRRAVTRAIVTLPAIAAAPALAADYDPDAAIKAAWERRQTAYTRYSLLPFADEPGEYTPEEKNLWAIVDQAEEEIRAAVAKTPEGVAIQLWVALYHVVSGREHDAMITRGDLDGLARVDKELDWNGRFVISALRSLRSMGGVA